MTQANGGGGVIKKKSKTKLTKEKSIRLYKEMKVCVCVSF
jgi:hypothetical protein